MKRWGERGRKKAERDGGRETEGKEPGGEGRGREYPPHFAGAPGSRRLRGP